MDLLLHLALSFSCLVGLGLLVWLPLIRFEKSKGLLWSDLGIIILSGALFINVHDILIKNWNDLHLILPIASLSGWIGFIFYVRKKSINLLKAINKIPIYSFIFFSLLSSVYFLKIITDPIWSFDARSIWFFSAKIIYFSNGLGDLNTWAIPNAHFYHFDYPKLIPILAARTAQSVGFWNEYLPKISLAVLLIPSISFLLEFKARPWNTVMLIILLLGIPGSHLWTGYMDGYIGLYASLGVLFWLHSKNTNSIRHIAVSILSFTTLAALKQEGLFFLIVFFIATIIWEIKIGLFRSFKKNIFLLVAIIPAALWIISRTKLGIHPDDFITGSLGRFISRVYSQEFYNNILMNLIFETGISRAAIPLLFSFTYAYFRKVKPIELPWLPILTGIGYAIFIVFVYLITPFELNYHVYSSITRISLPVVMMLVISSVLALAKIQQKNTIKDS
ncbi:MAG: hypothetical protein M9962_04540 [Oligoflexia bacterium]|nr:hypothetical protein [Oligoflexia bacterium]